MISDVLLLIGIVALVAAAALVSIALALLVVGVSLIGLALALSDARFPWRS